LFPSETLSLLDTYGVTRNYLLLFQWVLKDYPFPQQAGMAVALFVG